MSHGTRLTTTEGEVEGEGVDIAWPDLSVRDATAAASGPIWS